MITTVRTYDGGEFKNEQFENFCDMHGISHEFPKQNVVVERKNKSFQEIAKTMINHTTCHISFRPKQLKPVATLQMVYFLKKLKKRPHMNFGMEENPR